MKSVVQNTHFKDCEGSHIYGGQAVKIWDDEGGESVGIVVFFKKEWIMINPFMDKAKGFKSYASLETFSPTNIRILK